MNVDRGQFKCLNHSERNGIDILLAWPSFRDEMEAMLSFNSNFCEPTTVVIFTIFWLLGSGKDDIPTSSKAPSFLPTNPI